MAELLLYDWFRSARALQIPIVIMVDEVQNLRLGRGTVLNRIITEGRKFSIGSILDFGIPVFEHAYATSVENGPLFPNGKGGFWNEKNWRNRKFYPFLEEIGIQPNPYDENGKRKPEFAGKLATYTPYTTRHTYASLCDRAGVNKDILKRAVGHTPKSKTLDEVYLHPKATQMIEAFDKANQLVNDEVLTTTKA